MPTFGTPLVVGPQCRSSRLPFSWVSRPILCLTILHSSSLFVQVPLPAQLLEDSWDSHTWVGGGFSGLQGTNAAGPIKVTIADSCTPTQNLGHCLLGTGSDLSARDLSPHSSRSPCKKATQGKSREEWRTLCATRESRLHVQVTHQSDSRSSVQDASGRADSTPRHNLSFRRVWTLVCSLLGEPVPWNPCLVRN